MSLSTEITTALYSPNSLMAEAKIILVNQATFDKLKEELSTLYNSTMFSYKVSEEWTKPHKLEYHSIPVFRSPDIPDNEFLIIYGSIINTIKYEQRIKH